MSSDCLPDNTIKQVGLTRPGRRKRRRPADRDRLTRSQRGYTERWSVASRQYRAEHPLCVMCLRQGMTSASECVDHIKPHGGNPRLFWDVNNWQPLCWSCHSTKTRDEEGSKSKAVQYKTEVIVVTGPPCSGKSTYVDKHREHGDLIVDVDLLFQAISGCDLHDKPVELLPFVWKARDALIAAIGTARLRRAWIIKCSLTATDDATLTAKGAKIVEMDTSEEECKRRLLADRRRPKTRLKEYLSCIDEWFST